MKETTKSCHRCGSTRLRLFRSFSKKQCDECLLWMDWFLDPSQQPLVTSSRDKGFSENDHGEAGTRT